MRSCQSTSLPGIAPVDRGGIGEEIPGAAPRTPAGGAGEARASAGAATRALRSSAAGTPAWRAAASVAIPASRAAADGRQPRRDDRTDAVGAVGVERRLAGRVLEAGDRTPASRRQKSSASRGSARGPRDRPWPGRSSALRRSSSGCRRSSTRARSRCASARVAASRSRASPRSAWTRERGERGLARVVEELHVDRARARRDRTGA